MIVSALKEVGAARSIVIDERNVVLAGNGVIESASEAGITKVVVVDASGDEIIAVRRRGLSKKQKTSLALYDNRAGELSEWNPDQLKSLAEGGLDLDPFFTDEELAELYDMNEPKRGRTEPDEIPAVKATSIRVGDVFQLGPHRLMCGDTTDHESVRKLAGDESFGLLHADPPYGMGKESDGVANDNLYREKLDAFQVLWWQAWSQVHRPNGSAYIWGNAPDLWRLWYVGGMKDQGDLLVRNEIVWDKGSGFGMASSVAHSYSPATERCLFLMRGQQFIGNQNKSDYWEGYEPLRSWLEEQRNLAGWSNNDVNTLTKTHMAGHWFSKSQFAPISRRHYEVLTEAAGGRAFAVPYEELFDRVFCEVRSGGNARRRELAARMRETRTFFDNTHEAMTDVWNFGRVVGEERYGHATPKPVAMVGRAVKSSCDVGDVFGVPFVGTGPEFIAAEQWNRRAFGMELEPAYCQIAIDRWESFTGQKAKKVGEVCAAGASRRRRR